jgi:predicted HD superfamily hydrolase involved in NAD metabolism
VGMSEAESKDLYVLICQYINHHCSPKRRAHCLETGRFAQSLAPRFGAVGSKVLLAGTAHDMAREMPKKKMIDYALRDGRGFRKWEKKHPVLLHGRAAAVILREIIGVEDEEVLDAVRQHTLGWPDMGVVARIVYIADYLEPTREFLDNDDRADILKGDLESIMLFVTKAKIREIKRRGREVMKPTQKLYRRLKEKKRKRHEKKEAG